MKPNAVQQQSSVAYAHDLEAIWMHWEPWLRECERLLCSGAAQVTRHPDAIGLLRRTQYHAHTTEEFAAGLESPPAAMEAHEHLICSLAACRDVLSMLAVRVELDELDERSAELGLRSAAATREAFHYARGQSMMPHHPLVVAHVPTAPSQDEAGGMSITVWALTTLCALLVLALLVELVFLG